MNTLTRPLLELAEFELVREKLKKDKGIIQLSGCVESQKAHLICGLSDLYPVKLIVSENDRTAAALYEDYRFYDETALLFPARDLIFYQADIHSNQMTIRRMRVLKTMIEQKDVTVITSMPACMERLVPLEAIAEAVITLKVGDTLDVQALKTRLVHMGYLPAARVEVPGEFSMRGGILDIYPLTEESPWRIELFDDEIDSLRSFDAESQRSIENLTEIRIYPASELLLDEERVSKGTKKLRREMEKQVKIFREAFQTEEGARLKSTVEEVLERMEQFSDFTGLETWLCYFYPEAKGLLSYTGGDSLVILDEPIRMAECARAVFLEFSESMGHRLQGGYILPGQIPILMEEKEARAQFQNGHCLALSTMEPVGTDWRFTHKLRISVQSVSPYNNSFETLVHDLKRYKKQGYRGVLLSASGTRARRLAQDLREEGISAFFSEEPDRKLQPGELLVTRGHAHRGFEYPLLKYIVIADTDIFGRERKKSKRRKQEYSGARIRDFSELHVGDYVVHENHGLGVYQGIEKITMDKVTKDYIRIEYAGKSSLYILATQLEVLQKYAGSDAKKPALNRLGGQEWAKTKSRVKSAVKDIAHELVTLYAARQQGEGYAYSKDTVWQREFEELFPFEETEDQLAAIEDTKRDMESHKIMDRLICGDVGYGKTEIALRAAFKAVQENRQVVYLVPTTILAQQHFNTFTQRLKDFPVNVELLCRFRTPTQQKAAISGLKKGSVDIVIGTHRVLSKDVQFKNLGLLIIDEEQRFGVTHKEKIKQMKQTVDVLTLTATPIPRTLHMSLIGIRDMSVLEEAPQERVPIQTYVMEYSEEMVREAIMREMARGGQVYYVHNRVRDIADVAARIRQLVPEAHVAFAHGKMSERELERIMFDFINNEIDVLVSTTIIETGLDISNVNTIIIHDSDTMGLSQLYQLRGRVGRSSRTAYAFLMYRKNKLIKEVAEKRLHAIREYTDLGSGFKIAMRDLEIRGAGNLLGAQQSGHMEAVGYDLFCKMLNEAVQEEKGIQVEEGFETTMDLAVNAYIPETYIRDEFAKLDIYKRIAGIGSVEDYDDMLEELIDRFGDVPRTVSDLLAVALLKARAHKVYLTEVKQTGSQLRLTMFERAKVDPSRIPEFLERYKGRLAVRTDAAAPYFLYDAGPKSTRERMDVKEQLGTLLGDMEMLLPFEGKTTII